jgi:hydroxyacylglutathione hydrolase
MPASLDELAQLPQATCIHCAHEYTLASIEFSLRCNPSQTDVSEWYDKARAYRAGGAPTFSSTLRHELAINPFLRVHSPEIRAALIDQFNVPVPNLLAASFCYVAGRIFSASKRPFRSGNVGRRRY